MRHFSVFKANSPNVSWIGGITFILLLQVPQVFGQVGDEESQKQLSEVKFAMEKFIGVVKSQAIKNLGKNEISIVNGIEFRVMTDTSTRAYAINKGEKRFIYLAAGIADVVDMMTVGIMLGSYYHKSECSKEYIQLLVDGFQENTRRVRAGQGLRPIPRPFTFADARPDICSGLPGIEVNGDSDMRYIRDSFIWASLRYIILHEMAHHVLGHTSAKEPALALSRRWESAADAWAFKRMVEANVSPLEALPFMMLMLFVEGISLHGEEYSTHPARIRRFHEMIITGNEMLQNDPVFRKSLEETGMTEDWDQLLKVLNGLYLDAVKEYGE